MKKPTISLCMIVRDEADTLRDAIECVKPLCDEIVIGIDSRSSDESESIASEYADILYKFNWNGSFSDARNESISKCTKEWLLIWDAHEFMSALHIEKISDKMWSVVEDSCPAIGFKLVMEDGAVGMQTRLMKNGIGWKYSGKVHNQLNSSEIDPDAFQYDKIEVGDTILVQDDELGIDISARVQSKKLDLLEPWKTEYEIDNFEDRLPKTLRNEARRNNRLTRNIGNLMGRRVDDRKLSDSGLAVNKRELRILG